MEGFFGFLMTHEQTRGEEEEENEPQQQQQQQQQQPAPGGEVRLKVGPYTKKVVLHHPDASPSSITPDPASSTTTPAMPTTTAAAATATVDNGGDKAQQLQDGSVPAH